MRKSKIWIYVLYVIVLFGSLAATSWAMFMIRVWTGRTFKVIPGFIGSSVVCILFGFILGLEYFIKEFRKDGKWKIDIIRLTIMGIPSCIFAFYLVLFFTLPIPHPMPMFIYHNNFFFYFSSVIFGYMVITSINKKEEEIHQEFDTVDSKIMTKN